ncbi:MAG: response regulator, partial [Calditrichaeota bacterium]|nr:response regulator [Calditrichota bacterium]
HQEPFDDLSRELLSLMLQQASFSIGNLLLTHQLREAEVNYAAVYESSPLAILIIQDDVVKLFNRKYLELTGQTAERAHGDHFWTLLSEKDRSAIRDIFHRIEDRPEFLEREFQLEHAETGKVHCLGTFIQTLFSGKPAVLCEIKDITRLRNLEQQMLRAQRMEAIGNLAINVAHDFNNILGAIIPNAQLLLNETAQPELQKRAKAILYMARRAAKLTGRLLTYSDSEETGEKRINLNTLLKDGRAMFESLLGPAVSIHFDLNTALPDILGDPQHFMQILINLVANARDAMPEGGDLYIRTQPLNVLPGSEKAREIAAGEYVELCVRDTGLGVPEGLKRQIFRPFFTTKNPSDGSGLGLSIVSGLLKQHNGLITVESAETKGTTFRILMPVTQKPGAPAPVVAPPAARPPAKYIQGQGTILIVDDEKYLREVLVSMCKFLGFRCMEAGSGEEAIRLYEKNRDLIDYVILDFAMPGMNGKQTFDALKAIHQKLRVILCTGYADQRVINQLTRNEGVIYLPKPFTIELLDRKLRELTAKP